jgi:hypothetical protein
VSTLDLGEADFPADVEDRMLWRDAQLIFRRHAGPGDADRCGWCGRRWPCPPRVLAERADHAARRTWRESWTLRNDLNLMRGVELGRSGRNHGQFD